MSVSISQLSFEHHRLALGVAESEPRISWRFEGLAPNWTQTGYDIEVLRNGVPRVYSANSSDSILVPWPDTPLETAEQASVRARSHGQPDQPSTPWSDWSSVEIGLLNESDWGNAIPIAADRKTDVNAPKPPIYFRKSFSVDQEVKSARLYITALGVYEAEINGQRVGDYVMAPGWQSYNNRHVYDTYDVTHLIQQGSNGIGATVAEGWFSGLVGFGGKYRNNYGDTIGLLSLLVVILQDGTKVDIPTDTSWQANTGPTVASEIYNGETYDSRLEPSIAGWSSGSFNPDGWLTVKRLPALKGKLTPPDGPPVRRVEEIKPQRIFKSSSNKTLIDFGQNLAGRLRLSVAGPRGTNITLHHAEVLEGGELALRPLRLAKATDTLILNGNGTQIWEPRFTTHGFRYAQVDGWPESTTTLDGDSITAVVVHSDMERTGWFECSNESLNQFHNNVLWSMRGNFISIPTDCPQRDERLGWTGDAHAFGPAADYLYNTAGFWRGWHRDVWSEMQANGTMQVPPYVPIIPPNTDSKQGTAAVWGDVTVGGPFNHYQSFGDLVVLQEQYSQAQAWIETGIPRDDSGLWNRDTFQFGDWLDPKAPPDSPGDATTATHLVADAYLVRMTELLVNMSTALGYDDLAERYNQQHASLIKQFRNAWIIDGGMANRTQTAYALGLHFGIFTTVEERSVAGETLRKIIADNDYLVGTGFAGTPPLGFALAEIGATDDFYRMLLQTKVPSWLYQVVQNATTTWERWDSLLPNGTVNPGEMTSFNHYAFGSVADWIHQVIGGLAPAEPGWKKIKIAPVPGGNITSADSCFVSPYGKVSAKWQVDGDKFDLEVTVPPNTRAEITLPYGKVTREVGSGLYKFYELTQ
ncbi:glycoside hydrolase family 78 protein [Aspergillus alliaceus]|uniref:glycoside hydrolase family 78 protein n=1 Tax=Petromyces alliaceus TaxID=209559 RepID=UPI0012A75612|nr:bacterial alpha-L-rhamnosidase-domain-containing protein [Aspergillus alliaceus]KAB8235705.1 bacterial alpha-L-rhamnosidase-domain-containing protein [Aspergillus alliaceus]